MGLLGFALPPRSEVEERVGLTRAIHGARPSGAGFAGVQIGSPADLSNPSGFVHTTAHRTNRKGDPSGSPFLFVGGEGGIRTHGRITTSHDFESCAFGRSATSP